MSWAITDAVKESEEDMIRAQEEAWNRVRYRSEWFLGRTLGYCVISSLAAVYVFWHEAPSGPSVQVLAAVWVAFVTAALTHFDYRTRPLRQGWSDVAKHIPRHIALAALCLVIAIAAANAIHGISTFLEGKREVQGESVVSLDIGHATAPPTRWVPPKDEEPSAVDEEPTDTSSTADPPPPKPLATTPLPAKAVARPAHTAVATTMKRIKPKVKTAPVRRAAKPAAKRATKSPPKRAAKHTPKRRDSAHPWGKLVKVERRTPKHYQLNSSGF